MRLWRYYAFHTFINSIKKMFRSTFIIVLAVIIAIGFVFGMAGVIISSVIFEEGTAGEENYDPTLREGYGDSEYGMFDKNGEFLFYEDLVDEGLGGYDESGAFIYYEDALEQNLGYYDENGDFIFYYDEMTEEDVAQMFLVAEAAALVLVLIILAYGAHSGMKKGSDIFTMADVNFLFTAPIKPQSVLLFRLSFQMLAVITGSVYLLFQIPNLVINAGVSLEACLLIFVALIITFIYQRLFSVGMYTIVTTYEKSRKFVLPVLIGIVVILAGIVGLVYLSTGEDIWHTLELTLSSGWMRLIPIVGWIKGLFIHAIGGNVPMILIYLLLNIIGILGLVYAIWHIKADFYEDAMTGAQAKEDLLAAAKENRKVVEVNAYGKPKKEKRKVKESQGQLFGKSAGATVFFAKELLVRKRLARFGIVTTTMMWYFVICTGMSILFTKMIDLHDFTVIGIVLMFILFFRNYGNPIAQETSMNWLFLVPESPYKKVFFAMLASTYATAMDLLPGLIAAMLILEMNLLTVLLWLVTLVTMDFMLSTVGMVLEALFPASAMEVVKASIQLLLKFMMIIVIAAAIAIGTFIGGFEIGLVVSFSLNIVIGALCFLIYPAMLHDGIA